MRTWIPIAAAGFLAGCATTSPDAAPKTPPSKTPPTDAEVGQTASPAGAFEVLLHSQDLRYLWVTREVTVVKQDEEGDPVTKSAYTLMACRVGRNDEPPTCYVADIVGDLEDLVWPDDLRRYHLPDTPLGAVVPQPKDESDDDRRTESPAAPNARPPTRDDSVREECYYDNRHGTVCPGDPQYRRPAEARSPSNDW